MSRRKRTRLWWDWFVVVTVLILHVTVGLILLVRAMMA